MRKKFIASVAFLLASSTAVFAQSAAISDGKVKIGILNDQSGVYADFGGKSSVEAAKMAVEDFGGKVLDMPVEIVNADHQNKPDIASNIARQWYDTEQVDAIMELTTSSVALAVQAIAKEKKKIDIVTGAATTDLTGKACSPYGFHWAYDTHALAVGTGGALVKQGGDSWFFLTADYAFGYSLEQQTTDYVKASGGTVVGSVRHPLSTQDFSSFLLQAQSSGAKVIGLANAGLDTSNAIKQAGGHAAPRVRAARGAVAPALRAGADRAGAGQAVRQRAVVHAGKRLDAAQPARRRRGRGDRAGQPGRALAGGDAGTSVRLAGEPARQGEAGRRAAPGPGFVRGASGGRAPSWRGLGAESGGRQRGGVYAALAGDAAPKALRRRLPAVSAFTLRPAPHPGGERGQSSAAQHPAARAML